MEGQYEFFLLKIPKMEGTTVKKTPKGDFCYMNRKNRSTPLVKGHIYLKLGN